MKSNEAKNPTGLSLPYLIKASDAAAEVIYFLYSVIMINFYNAACC
jgi:hypothetical protein